MKYLMGIDGGGTNSRLLAVSAAGETLGCARGRSTNIESNPVDTVREHLRELICGFMEESGLPLASCAGICLGTAGVDTQETLRTVEEIMESLALPFPCVVTNDAEIALLAQTGGEAGILLISGTGSIGYGMNAAGETCRVGGYGYLVSDEGSSFWVAKKAIAAALRAYDGTAERTALLDRLVREIKADRVEQLVDFVYAMNKSELAKLAPAVSDAADEGDSMAADIMLAAAEHLANMAISLASRLSMENSTFPLVLAGGFLLNTPSLMRRVETIVAPACPKATIMPLAIEAEWGAVHRIARALGMALPKA